jgi:hypothetical protein
MAKKAYVIFIKLSLILQCSPEIMGTLLFLWSEERHFFTKLSKSFLRIIQTLNEYSTMEIFRTQQNYEITGNEIRFLSDVKESLLIFPYVHKIISLIHIGILYSTLSRA